MSPEQGRGRFAVVGLGNPGRRYTGTRHNAGWEALRRLASLWKASFHGSRPKAAFCARPGGEVFLIFPDVFMNLSGQTVGPFLKKKAISLSHCLVLVDDMDLPVGAIRLRPGGGCAGHRGLESLVQAFGTSSFPRLRIGIGKPVFPDHGADFVLSRAGKDEMPRFEEGIEKAALAAQAFVEHGLTWAMNHFNRKTPLGENREME